MPKAQRNNRQKIDLLHRKEGRTAGLLLREKATFLQSHGIESPRLHCLILLSKIVGKSKEYLLAHPELILTPEQVSVFSNQVLRLLNGEPIAYIIGEKEFWDHIFLCSPVALIPRPETELLVEKALDAFEGREVRRFVDLGTGTGAVGITLAHQWPESQGLLTDINFDALLLAKQNCTKILGDKHQIFLLCSDWFGCFKTGFKADVITVNPPYVSIQDIDLLQDNVKRFEPSKALFSRDDSGLFEIKTLFAKAPNYLSKNGVILCEIGINQWQDVMKFVKGLNCYRKVNVFKDLSGIERVIAAWL